MHDTRLIESPDKGLARDWFELAINTPAPVGDAELVQQYPRAFRKLRSLLEKRLEASNVRGRKGNHVCPTCGRAREPLTALDGGFVPMEAIGRDGLCYRPIAEVAHASFAANGNGWATPLRVETGEQE